MQSDNKFLIEEFENEVWLYIDKTLDDEKMRFWSEQINTNEQIKAIYNEINSTLTSYNQISEEAVSEVKFSKMIDNAIRINNKSIFRKISDQLKNISVFGIDFSKLALGGSLAVSAFLILLFSNKPNPVKEISADLLEWEPLQLNSRIEKTEYDLAFIKDKELENYLLERLQNDPWKQSYYNIKSSIDKIEKEINKESL